MHEVRTARLELRPATLGDVPRLASLFRSPYVRRYLFDDLPVDPSWVEAQVAASARMFDAHGYGLWLFGPAGAAAVGFAGFISHEEEPMLIYGQAGEAAGRGYAREAAAAVIAHAERSGLSLVKATVDEANARSLHLLHQLGFAPYRVEAGRVGQVLYLSRAAEKAAGAEARRSGG